MQITIINQQKRIPVRKRAVKKIALNTLRILNPVRNTTSPKGRTKFSNGVKAHLSGELSIIYVDNKAIQELNHRFLGKRCPTDVLCFDLSEGSKFLADIVISTEKAFENSRVFKTSPLWEANLYLVHGLLHLLGFKDRRKKDRLRMHRKAIQILTNIENR